MEKVSGSKQTLNFGKEENGMPSCTCKDWQQHQIPCKHFFAVFQHRPEWQWEQLPKSYLQSAYLSTDRDSLDMHFDFSANHDDQQVLDTGDISEDKKVGYDTNDNELPRKVNSEGV